MTLTSYSISHGFENSDKTGFLRKGQVWGSLELPGERQAIRSNAAGKSIGQPAAFVG